MHAIIPAAGLGTRLRPLTHTTPKALLPVAGKPIIGHILDLLAPAGVDRITLVTGHLGSEIACWVKSNYSFETFAVEQTSLDGLASAVAMAEPNTDDGPTLVVLADTLFTADLSALRGERRNMLAVSRVDDPSRFGVVVESGGAVRKLVEKPAEFISDLAIVGVYYFTNGLEMIGACRELMMSGTRTRGEFQLTDAMQMMLGRGAPFGMFTVSDWFDCGKPETLLQTNAALLDRAGGNCREIAGSTVVPPVHVAAGASIEGCLIGPHASIGAGCSLKGCIVRNSILSEGCILESAFLDGSILGRGASITGRPLALSIGDSSSLLV